MIVCWTAADGMQVHRKLRLYLGIWLCVYLLTFFTLCLLKRGFLERDLLLGILAPANITISAADTHLQACFTLLLFVLKDVVSECFSPGNCSVIRAPVKKQWLYGGEIDRNDEYKDEDDDDDEGSGGARSEGMCVAQGAGVGGGGGGAIGAAEEGGLAARGTPAAMSEMRSRQMTRQRMEQNQPGRGAMVAADAGSWF